MKARSDSKTNAIALTQKISAELLKEQQALCIEMELLYRAYTTRAEIAQKLIPDVYTQSEKVATSVVGKIVGTLIGEDERAEIARVIKSRVGKVRAVALNEVLTSEQRSKAGKVGYQAGLAQRYSSLPPREKRSSTPSKPAVKKIPWSKTYVGPGPFLGKAEAEVAIKLSEDDKYLAPDGRVQLAEICHVLNHMFHKGEEVRTPRPLSSHLAHSKKASDKPRWKIPWSRKIPGRELTENEYLLELLSQEAYKKDDTFDYESIVAQLNVRVHRGNLVRTKRAVISQVHRLRKKQDGKA